MDVWRTDNPKGIPATLAKVEALMGLPTGFCIALEKEPDDWTFVLKLHALFEAGLTHLIISQIGRAELLPAVARLDIGGASEPPGPQRKPCRIQV